MKQKFSTQWKASRLPRKQKKYRANAPFHIRHRMMSAHLSKELRKKYGKRNFPLRKGDEVRIMRGGFKGKKGKVEKINMKKMKASVEGIFRSKKDGTKVGVYFSPSKLQVQELNLEDKKRREAIERKQNFEKKEIKEIKEDKNAHKKK